MSGLKYIWVYTKVLFRWVRNHKYISVTLAFFFIVFVVDDNNMIKHISNQNKIRELENEIMQMRADSARLMQQQSLFGPDGNLEQLEKMGRESGMKADNEDIFVIE